MIGVVEVAIALASTFLISVLKRKAVREGLTTPLVSLTGNRVPLSQGT
jgi:hypothetical protein